MKALLASLLLAATLLAADETLTTTKGVVYRSVRITEVEPDGITIFHAGGVAKVPFRELPEELRRKYGYDARKAAQAEARDAQEQARISAQRQAEANRARIAQLEKDIAHADAIAAIERKRQEASAVGTSEALRVSEEEQRRREKRKAWQEELERLREYNRALYGSR